jgi:hypothetical protein
MADQGFRPPPPTLLDLWHNARDIDAAVAQRLGLTGPDETRRRALAWGLAVLGVLLVALVLSPVVAGGQSGPEELAPEATTSTTEVTDTTLSSLPPRPPEATDDRSYGTDEDQALTVGAAAGVLANDSYPDRGVDQLKARLVDTPPGTAIPSGTGELDLEPDGSFTYTPSPEFAGIDSFFYVAADRDDPSATSAPARIEITVSFIDDTPRARPDQFSTPQDVVLRVDAPGVLINDDDDGENVMVAASRVSDPNHGEVVDFRSDGSFTYRPDPGFRGPDSFRYTVSDSATTSEPAQVTIEVREANLAPSANDDGYSTGTGEALSVPAPGLLANDTDANNDALAARSDVDPPTGTVSVGKDGGFTYRPPPGFRGVERFTYFANDGTTDSEPATVAIVVGPAAEAFALGKDAYSVDRGAALAVPAPGVLANDGIAGSARRAQEVRGPAVGALEFNGDGSFVYVPDAGFAGEDSFEYAVTLGDAVSPPETVVLTVVAVAGPSGPTSPTVLAPVTPPPPTPPSTVAPPPASAPPDASSNGADAGDAGGREASPGADPAAPGGGGGATDGGGGVIPGEPTSGVTVDLAGEFEGELGETPLVSLMAPAPEGQVVINGDGTVTYVPVPEALGRDSFGYRVCSIDEVCATGVVELLIRSVPGGNGPPEVRFKIVRDGAVPWLTVAVALAVLVFAAVMAVLVIRAVRGPADPFAGASLPSPTPSLAPRT